MSTGSVPNPRSFLCPGSLDFLTPVPGGMSMYIDRIQHKSINVLPTRTTTKARRGVSLLFAISIAGSGELEPYHTRAIALHVRQWKLQREGKQLSGRFRLVSSRNAIVVVQRSTLEYSPVFSNANSTIPGPSRFFGFWLLEPACRVSTVETSALPEGTA